MDTARFERRIRELEALGHRGSATPGEHRAADYLAGEMRAAGIEPVSEEFRGASCMGERLLIHMTVATVGAALLWRAPLASIVLGAVALISLLFECSTRGVWLSWPVSRRRSLNAWGRLKAPEARGRLILCAHYDTQPAGWIWTINRVTSRIGYHSPLVLKSPMLPVAGLMAGQIVLGAIATARNSGLVLSILDTVLLGAYTVLVVLLVQWSMGRPVPGAADNASGVAAVLEIAAAWRDSPPAANVELIVLLTGCEECGMLGASAWIDVHRAEIQSLPTVFLNVDGIGMGPPRFLGAEVPAAGVAVRADRRVLELCRGVATRMGLVDAGPHALTGPTDGLAFLTRKIPGATIVGFQNGGILPNYHTARDTADNMDWPSAKVGLEFAREVCWRLTTRSF